MLNEERRRHILDILSRDGRVLVVDLAKQFRTSQVTIRKDLDILQAHGRIQRSHGGALPAREGALEDPTLREKEKLYRKEKLQIAAAAARMVQEPLNPAVLEAARQLVDRTELRWPDAIQLGAAIVAREMFQGTEIIFVSASQCLLEAAKTEGFAVLDPLQEAA